MGTYSYQNKNRNSKVSALALSASPERVFWILVSLVAIFSLLYISLIATTIRNVVALKNAKSSVTELSVKVSNLESQYLELQEKSDLSSATALGYGEISNVAYVPRTRALSMRVGNGEL